MILLDTNVLSALMRSEPEAVVVDWLDALPADPNGDARIDGVPSHGGDSRSWSPVTAGGYDVVPPTTMRMRKMRSSSAMSSSIAERASTWPSTETHVEESSTDRS